MGAEGSSQPLLPRAGIHSAADLPPDQPSGLFTVVFLDLREMEGKMPKETPDERFLAVGVRAPHHTEQKP